MHAYLRMVEVVELQVMIISFVVCHLSLCRHWVRRQLFSYPTGERTALFLLVLGEGSSRES